ncbi:uncharacterized protein LOC122047643 isoform X1 [Zingiber officinale]|uniref:uncharacterized protein LOC122047643 isoform X1 n=1 Tax=Zingiber officinale TaxID=94328 RepID=UPI001C4AF9C1|nr:uncharacterized protein LOC122047643 isoform X1 [Zingiber officinale]
MLLRHCCLTQWSHLIISDIDRVLHLLIHIRQTRVLVKGIACVARFSGIHQVRHIVTLLRRLAAQRDMRLVAVLPGECVAALAPILVERVVLDVGLEVRLDGVGLGAMWAFQVLGSVLTVEVFLDAGDVTECAGAVAVDAGWDGADVGLAAHWGAAGLLEFIVDVMSAHVELQILVALEALAAHCANVPTGGQQILRPQRHHLCTRIWPNEPSTSGF